ncbi:MAG: hypothetical protein ACUVRS_09655 [Armatimonadota bacterium]
MRSLFSKVVICLVLVVGAGLLASEPQSEQPRVASQQQVANSTAQTATLPRFAKGVKCGNLQSEELSEVSGIVASRKNMGLFWVHNDSGDSARVFAITSDGTVLGIYNLAGVNARDWEDIAVGPGPVKGASYVYVGDIGDNNAARPQVWIYRFLEPKVSVNNQRPVTHEISDVQRITIKYEDGPRDAEALMIDPCTGDLYIISKRENRSKVYRASSHELVDGALVTVRAVARLPWGWATGGDISPDGSEIIVRGYANAALWKRPASGELWRAFEDKQYIVPVEREQQGEAICFDAAGKGYYTTSEGVRAPIYFYARLE